MGLSRISKTVHRIRWAALSAQKLRSSALVTLSCSCNNQVSYFLKERPCSLSNYTKGALLYGVTPVCALGETEHPGHLNVRGVLRHCVPNKGLHPLRRYAAILADLVSGNGFASRSRRPSFRIVSLTVSNFWRSFFIQIF